MNFIKHKKYYQLEDGTKVNIYAEVQGPREVGGEDTVGYDYHRGYGKDKNRMFKVGYKVHSRTNGFNIFVDVTTTYIEEVPCVPSDNIASNT